MGTIGPWQIILILVIVLILFGAGRLPQVMEELARGARSFRDGFFDKPKKKPPSKKKKK